MSSMNLSRGNCILCTNCKKIVNPSDASSITKQLPQLLEGLIDDQKVGTVTFQNMKICPLCLQDILFLVEYKSHIKDHSETSNNCSVCLGDNNLVSVKDWNNFETIIEKVLKVEKQKCYIICLKCIWYLQTLDRIKTSFIKQNPKLALKNSPKKKITKDSPRKSYPTPSNNSHSNKATEGSHEDHLEKALRHLKPLQLLNFDLDQFQKDKKLLNQIAFVKLQSLKAAYKHKNHINKSDNSQNTSGNKHHSFFKIKLKMRPSFKTKRITKVSPKKIKQQSTVDPEFSGKRLSVKLLKMDLDKVTEEHSVKSAVRRSTGQTPTKASLKYIEEPLSSSKKRKSVTFAPCIDKVLDEVITKEENRVQTPIKSLLKHSFDLLEQTESVNEENGMVSKKKDCDNADNNVDSDEDDISNKLDPFTEHLKNNSDSIFERLKSEMVQNSNSIENIVVDKDNDSESASGIMENSSTNSNNIVLDKDNNSESSSRVMENSSTNSNNIVVDKDNDSESASGIMENSSTNCNNIVLNKDSNSESSSIVMENSSTNSNNIVLDKDNDNEITKELMDSCSCNKNIDISDQNEQNNEDNSDQNASELQIDSDIRSELQNNESQEISESIELELQSKIDDDSSKNELTEHSQDKQESNEENCTNENEATRKRKLSENLSVSSELDSIVEPETKRLKLGEEEETPMDRRELDSINKDNCVAESSNIVDEKVIATIVVNSQEDTGNENGKSFGISEKELDLHATEI